MRKNGDNLIVRLPRFFFWLGVVNNLFWGFMIISMAFIQNHTTELWVYLGFVLFLLLGTWFIWITIVWL